MSEDQPYDDRHYTQHDGVVPEPPGFLPQSMWVGPPAMPDAPLPWSSLTWQLAPGLVIPDVGRITRDMIVETPTLDLRIILAHLDSAAAVIQAELGDR